MLKYLQIAFSATCGIICLLLVVLWVRSYWNYDNLQLGGVIGLASLRGQLLIDEVFIIEVPVSVFMESVTRFPLFGSTIMYTALPAEGATMRGSGTSIPDLFLVMATAALVAAPWIRWRFSLRTLLIGMTLIAAGLGLIVAFAR